MADISDVERAIVDAVTSILYPTGFPQPSIIGSLCRIYRGWPNAATLNADLSAGTVNVTIGTDNASGRTTTRFLPQWRTISGEPGTTVTTSGRMITIAGCPASGDVVGLIIDGTPYAYRILTGDSPSLVASNLKQSIQAKRIASVQGNVITIPDAVTILARVVCDNVAYFEGRRQEKDLRIIFWCPTPIVRDTVTAVVDASFSQIEFLPLPDSTQARIVYRNTESYDQAQNALLYRRDLVYLVEYPTITAAKHASMLFGSVDLNSNITYG
jgi:hypothetical protein